MVGKHSKRHTPLAQITRPVTRNGLIDNLKQVIGYMENLNIPFIYFVLTFVAAITLRNFMEIMVAQNVVRIFWYTPVHYSLFYISLLFNITLILRALSGERVERILKVVMACFLVTATVPLTDLLFQLIWSYDIKYLYMVPEKTKNIWHNYFLFFGSHKGATPGMRIEILAAMTGAALYVYTKTDSKLRGFVTAVLIYSLIFWLYGAIIFLILGLERLAGLPYDTSYKMMIHVFLFMSFHSLLLVAYYYNPQYFKAILKDFRLTRILHYELMVLFGMVIGYSGTGATVLRLSNFIELYFIAVSVMCACVFSAITNNLADVSIDRITNPERPSVTESIPQQSYERIGYILLAISMTCSLAVDYLTMFLIACFIGNYFLYSMPPLRLKRVPVFSKGLIALNCLIVMLVGYNFVGKQIPLFPPDLAAFVLIMFTVCINFIDIKDYEGDKAEDIKTLPVLIGLERSKLLIGIFFMAGYAVTPYFLKLPGLYFPSVLSGMLIFYLITRKNYREWPVFSVYLASGVYLLVYLVFKSNVV
ncbi:MAG: UbiA family prenyltransferase [Geobacteraceae bacterium]|nr:UbiA family prenyltransferase [Geobacteraceae bacterium]